MSTTSIEWTDTTWNPVVGCTWASSGCDSCYAARMTRRLEAMGQKDYAGLTSKKHFNGTVRTLEHRLTDPLSWRKPRRVFVNSMSDLFHKDVPFDFVAQVFGIMQRCPQHTFQILTKRPERMAEFACEWWGPSEDSPRGRIPLRNVWLGTSVENQATADERIPHLLRVPAAVRFLSCEPLLSWIDLRLQGVLTGNRGGRGSINGEIVNFPGISWVIVGGESGPGARPFDVLWAERMRNECRLGGIAYFLKQLGSRPMIGDSSDPRGWPTENGPVNWETGDIRLNDRKGGDMAEWPADLRVREMPVPRPAPSEATP